MYKTVCIQSLDLQWFSTAMLWVVGPGSVVKAELVQQAELRNKIKNMLYKTSKLSKALEIQSQVRTHPVSLRLVQRKTRKSWQNAIVDFCINAENFF